MFPKTHGMLMGRKLEFFHHDTDPEWGYEEQQTDSFALIHPKDEESGEKYPLYVVFHSAGHDVYSTVGCTWAKGNHDIYRTPDNMFGLYLDCRANMNDWWWGGINAHNEGDPKRSGTALQPVEKRALATVEWVLRNYPADRERVYAVGNSMGGSGALGVCLCRGDVFAAIKANVPAGVRHAADRCCLDTEAPEGFKIPDPPVVVDYSGQNDIWSDGHETLYNCMRDKKYALVGFWGMFGHENDDEKIKKYNDLVNSFDISSVKRNEAYPVFTNSSTDDPIPWCTDRKSEASGQVNAFFRWKVLNDSAEQFEIELRLLREDEFSSSFVFPEVSEADVSFRRVQNFKVSENETLDWSFGSAGGVINADENSLITVPRLSITKKPAVLRIKRHTN
ncbi:MAG: hypothetical protein PUE85_03725 [Firmicutes bacterium]|nr:hypothetical protein [Bacillota bacterium]